MSKFLRIIEDVSPEEVDRVSTLFNREVVTDVRGIRERDTIMLTLKDGATVSLKIQHVSQDNQEEDNEQQIMSGTGTPSKLMSAKDREVLKTAGELGVDPIRRTFGIGDPVKNLGKAVGDFYNRLATRLKNISAKMSV